VNFLFVHRYLIGQFKHLIQYLGASGRHRIVCLGQIEGPEARTVAEGRQERHFYRLQQGLDRGNQGLEGRFGLDLAHAAAAARSMEKLKRSGFVPDLILAHTGWGEALFCKDVFPDVPLIGYFEYFYRSEGGDADFFPGHTLSLESRGLIRALNAGQLLSLADCDAGVSPTSWQRNGFPTELRGKIQQIHEGVDLNEFRPSRQVRLTLETGQCLSKESEVVTYVSRSLEPFRGFPQFLQAIQQLQRRRPRMQVLVAGGDDVTYSPPLAGGLSYRETLCRELDLDLSRIHFLGWLQGEAYRRLLQVSSVHVYLTPPFVLSWSMLEAMASGCVVAASDTAPVREVIQDGETGLLFDFFAPDLLAGTIEAVLDHPTRMRELGHRAREQIASHYDVNGSIARYRRLIGSLTGETAGL
jgi:glycosyltransferase involved in cell wall biosynthesis